MSENAPELCPNSAHSLSGLVEHQSGPNYHILLLLCASVNLMIARMTSTYEKVQGESHFYRAHQRVSLTAEFKDERGQPPPFNVIILLVEHILPKRKQSKVTKGYMTLMGKMAALRLQTRERAMAHKFHSADISRAKHTMDAQFAVMRDKTSSIEALSRQMYRLQTDMYRDLTQLHEQQAAIVKRLDELKASGP